MKNSIVPPAESVCSLLASYVEDPAEYLRSGVDVLPIRWAFDKAIKCGLYVDRSEADHAIVILNEMRRDRGLIPIPLSV